MASTTVFTTTELLESILTHLPTKDLLLSQGVNKTWQKTITGSPTLQRALFFQPAPATLPTTRNKKYTLNPLLTTETTVSTLDAALPDYWGFAMDPFHSTSTRVRAQNAARPTPIQTLQHHLRRHGDRRQPHHRPPGARQHAAERSDPIARLCAARQSRQRALAQRSHAVHGLAAGRARAGASLAEFVAEICGSFGDWERARVARGRWWEAKWSVPLGRGAEGPVSGLELEETVNGLLRTGRAGPFRWELCGGRDWKLER